MLGDSNIRIYMLTKKQICLTVLFVFIFNPAAFSKLKPYPLTEVISSSQLISIINVSEIKFEGKSRPASAIAQIVSVLKGKQNTDKIKINWEGSGINTLGEWLVFLQKSENNQYQPTSGIYSFWPIRYVKQDKQLKKFTILKYPIKHLIFPDSLISKQPVYVNDLPSYMNPVTLKGILLEQLNLYIKQGSKK